VEGSPDAETLIETRWSAPGAGAAAARFEPEDWFLFPVSGFAHVARGGPDLVLYRIRRREGTAPVPCGPPRVTVLPGPGRPELDLAPAAVPACGPVAWYARLQRGRDVREDSWTRPILRPYTGRPLGVPPEIPAGVYLVSFAAGTLSGLGEWSDPVLVELR
jgi:hypothetical protein